MRSLTCDGQKKRAVNMAYQTVNLDQTWSAFEMLAGAMEFTLIGDRKSMHPSFFWALFGGLIRDQQASR